MKIGLYHHNRKCCARRIVSEDSQIPFFWAFPADCPHWMDCHCRFLDEYHQILTEFPAYSQVFLRNYNGQIFIVTAAVYWGFSSLLRLTANRSL